MIRTTVNVDEGQEFTVIITGEPDSINAHIIFTGSLEAGADILFEFSDGTTAQDFFDRIAQALIVYRDTGEPVEV